jgi:hypothetical protein
MLMKGPLSIDRGATAIIVAICLLLLCGMAALAVDLGFGFRERRFDQAAADAAALGASLEMVITNQANPVRAAVTNVYQLVDQNLAPRTVPPPDWSACTDTGALFWQTKTDGAILQTADIGSDCISLSENFNTLRVRVPLQGVDTIFGAVLGFNEIDVTAAAEAERNTDWGGGGDFPSGVLSGTSAGSTVCIKTGTAGVQESCGSPSTGDFGNFKPYFYSAVDGVISSICESGEQKWSIARAMADGIDHEFSAYNLVAPNPRINGQWCNTSGVPGPPFPNMVDSAAGYQSGDDITWGLVSGGTWTTNYTGRLTRGPYVSPNATIFGFNVDNRPLWDYIDNSLDFSAATGFNLPNCELAQARPAEIFLIDHPAAMTQLVACLDEADDAGVSIFTPDLFNTHRLAHAPLYHEGPPPAPFPPLGFNACCYHIKGLVPIFIQSLYARSAHVTFTCDGEFDDTVTDMCVHHPGLTGSMGVGPKGLQKVDSASALVLSCALLPAGTCPTIQDGTNPLNFLYDLQLTR